MSHGGIEAIAAIAIIGIPIGGILTWLFFRRNHLMHGIQRAGSFDVVAEAQISTDGWFQLKGKDGPQRKYADVGVKGYDGIAPSAVTADRDGICMWRVATFGGARRFAAWPWSDVLDIREGRAVFGTVRSAECASILLTGGLTVDLCPTTGGGTYAARHSADLVERLRNCEGFLHRPA